MITRLATGGFRDYLELEAETPSECLQLVRIAHSSFIEKDRVMLDLGDPIEKTLRLRVWMSAPRPEPSPAERARINAEQDATP